MRYRHNRKPARKTRIRRPKARSVTYFASGTHYPGEIRGFIEGGANVGSTVPDCDEECLREYERAPRGTKVFIDSGAFSEVARKGPPVVVDPMTHEDWKKVFRTYFRLGKALGDQLYVVAPDQIANQRVSFERMKRYMPQLAKLNELGVNFIVPIQGGEFSRAQYEKKVMELFDSHPSFRGQTDKLIRGIPTNKGRPTRQEMRAYLKKTKPKRVHFLGLGPSKRSLWGTKNYNIKGIVEEVIPSSDIFMDSVRITGLVGRIKGPLPKLPKPGAYYTATQDEAAAELSDEMGSALDTDIMGQEMGWETIRTQLASYSDWSWMPPEMVQKTASDILRQLPYLEMEETPKNVQLLEKVRRTGKVEDFEKWLNQIDEMDYTLGRESLILEAIYPHWKVYTAELALLRQRGMPLIRKEWREVSKDIVQERKRRAARRLTPAQLFLGQTYTPQIVYDVVHSGGTTEVEALAVGGVWGIHEESIEEFAITHIPTGRILMRVYSVTAAERELRDLLDILPDFGAKKKMGSAFSKDEKMILKAFLTETQ